MAQRRHPISVEDKLRLVRGHRALQDYQLLADHLGINRSSALTIVSAAMKQADPEQIVVKPRGGPWLIKVAHKVLKVNAHDIFCLTCDMLAWVEPGLV